MKIIGLNIVANNQIAPTGAGGYKMTNVVERIEEQYIEMALELASDGVQANENMRIRNKMSSMVNLARGGSMRTIRDLIRVARLTRRRGEFLRSESLNDYTMYDERNKLHISNGRKLFPPSRIHNRPHDNNHTYSYVSLQIDGSAFEFFWLSKLK